MSKCSLSVKILVAVMSLVILCVLATVNTSEAAGNTLTVTDSAALLDATTVGGNTSYNDNP